MIDFPIPTVPSKFAPDDGTIVNDWYLTVGGEYLRAVEGTEDWPTAEELGSYLLREALRQQRQQLLQRIGSPAARPISHDRLVALADDAATYLLKRYRPRNRRRFTSEQARDGGKKSKRTNQKTMRAFVALLEKLEATGEVMSWVEVARELGITPRYLRTLRKQHAAYLASWADLLAMEDPTPIFTPIPKTKRCVVPRKAPSVLPRLIAEHPEWGLGQPIDMGHFLDDFPEIPPIQWAVAA